MVARTDDMFTPSLTDCHSAEAGWHRQVWQESAGVVAVHNMDED